MAISNIERLRALTEQLTDSQSQTEACQAKLEEIQNHLVCLNDMLNKRVSKADMKRKMEEILAILSPIKTNADL